MVVLETVLILYLVVALACLGVGICQMYEYAEFGREDDDFKEAKLMVCLSWCPPLLLYKMIKRKLDDADRLYDADGKDDDNG